MTIRAPLLCAALLSIGSVVHACELCAISSANSTRGEAGSGFSFTLSLQACPGCESRARDELFGTKAPNTGLTTWYLGPQVTFTYALHFAAQTAVDLPLWITKIGCQNLPEYRIEGTWMRLS